MHEATMMPAGTKARLLLFTGDGKGKTTAALGMMLRAAGHGMTSLLVSFIKSDETGELVALRRLAGVEARQVGCGFVMQSDDATQMGRHRAAAVAGLIQATADIASGRYRLVVLDEVCSAVALGLLEEAAVCEAVRAAQEGSIVVMTGRDAPAGLIAMADTVTEMGCIRHGYDLGFPAMAGVEF
jgi:cob(I)alamin adenosyltransferase